MDIHNDNHLMLDEMIKNFYEDKQQADHFKKIAEDFNSQIKELLTQENLKEFETTNGLIAKMTIQKRESFDEDKLIAKLKVLNGYTAIKTKEYVDMDELENLIYNGHIDAGQLTDCKQIKEVTTLKVNKKKGN